MMVIWEEEGFDDAVSGECDGRNTKARKGPFEAVPPGEGASVSPGLTVEV